MDFEQKIYTFAGMIQTQMIDIGKLEFNVGQIPKVPKNPRFIKDSRYKKLVKSMADFPELLELRELIVFPWKKKFVVLAGNQRLRGGKELKHTSMPCKVLSFKMDAKSLKRIVVLDNVKFGEDDWKLLEAEWHMGELKEWGVEIPDFHDALIPGGEDNFVPEDPNKIKTKIKPGDIIEIGLHRLICGDATNIDHIKTLMNGKRADLVFTDPPYNVNYGTNNSENSGGWSKKNRAIQNDHMSGKKFAEFIKAAFINIGKYCDGIIYCFGAQGMDGRIMFTVLDNMFHNSGTIIWVKDSLVLGRSKYHNKYEPCWFGWNKTGKTFTDNRKLTNVWECERPKKSDLHPTMKPIKLIETALIHNPSANIILDLFGGSGSTMVGAHQMKRICYMAELDPKYCQTIIDRMLNLIPNIAKRLLIEC